MSVLPSSQWPQDSISPRCVTHQRFPRASWPTASWSHDCLFVLWGQRPQTRSLQFSHWLLAASTAVFFPIVGSRGPKCPFLLPPFWSTFRLNIFSMRPMQPTLTLVWRWPQYAERTTWEIHSLHSPYSLKSVSILSLCMFLLMSQSHDISQGWATPVLQGLVGVTLCLHP